ncbi:MAG: RnfABCDGE type electron transport complex subunit G [Bacteroidales bacterium]|nr:RnfABCDGE type electron transport complex subunit G [Bacteroidales bacterium]
MIDKKNPTIVQMIAVLLIVAAVCSAGVAAVYAMTKDTIAETNAKKLQKSLSEVLPQYDMTDTLTITTGDTKAFCYIAKKDGAVVGYAIKASNTNGYNGLVEVLTGFDKDGKIINTSATVLNETPGLGQKALEPKFADQFKGFEPSKKTLKVKKDGGDVDAISAATITSRAYTLAVQQAFNALQTHLGNKVDTNSGATSSANKNADEREIENDK